MTREERKASNEIESPTDKLREERENR